MAASGLVSRKAKLKTRSGLRMATSSEGIGQIAYILEKQC
jgi:hypothetical protein